MQEIIYMFFRLAGENASMLLTVAICLSVMTCFLLVRKGKLRWLVNLRFSLILIGVMGVIVLVAGLSAFPHLFLLSAVAKLVYAVCLVSLGTLLVVRGWRMRKVSFHFMCIHGGFWLMLLALGMGEYDRKEYWMPVLSGKTEWRGRDVKDVIKELPIAIRMTGVEEKEKIYADIIVFTRSGSEKRGKVSVNHPLYLSGWRIYAESYNSEQEVFQMNFRLVSDPWHYVFSIGMFLLGAGSIVFLLNRIRQK